MKTILKTSLALYIFTMMLSCNSSASKTQEVETQEVVSINAKCIYDYIDKYDQLLTLEQIQKHYVGDMSKAKMKYNKSNKPESQKQDSYLYSWPSGKTKSIDMGGMKLDVPLNNEIGIKWLGDDLYKIMGKENAIASFEAFYRTPTENDIEKGLQKGEEKLSEDKTVANETKSSAMEMAKELSKNAKYENVNGIGDAASWDVRDNALIILIGEKTIKIVANVGTNSEENKKLAIALSNEVFKKCN